MPTSNSVRMGEWIDVELMVLDERKNDFIPLDIANGSTTHQMMEQIPLLRREERIKAHLINAVEDEFYWRIRERINPD